VALFKFLVTSCEYFVVAHMVTFFDEFVVIPACPRTIPFYLQDFLSKNKTILWNA
jgi:hypothetical protein